VEPSQSGLILPAAGTMYGCLSVVIAEAAVLFPVGVVVIVATVVPAARALWWAGESIGLLLACMLYKMYKTKVEKAKMSNRKEQRRVRANPKVGAVMMQPPEVMVRKILMKNIGDV